MAYNLHYSKKQPNEFRKEIKIVEVLKCKNRGDSCFLECYVENLDSRYATWVSGLEGAPVKSVHKIGVHYDFKWGTMYILVFYNHKDGYETCVPCASNHFLERERNALIECIKKQCSIKIQ